MSLCPLRRDPITQKYPCAAGNPWQPKCLEGIAKTAFCKGTHVKVPNRVISAVHLVLLAGGIGTAIGGSVWYDNAVKNEGKYLTAFFVICFGVCCVVMSLICGGIRYAENGDCQSFVHDEEAPKIQASKKPKALEMTPASQKNDGKTEV